MKNIIKLLAFCHLLTASSNSLSNLTFSNQNCMQGIHKLSPDGTMIARQTLNLKNKHEIVTTNKEYDLEIIQTDSLEKLYSDFRSSADFFWSLDGKSIYANYYGSVGQFDITKQSFNQMMTYSKPWAVDYLTEKRDDYFNIGVIGALFSDLGYIPYISPTENNSAHYSDLILAEGSHQVKNSPSPYQIETSNKKVVYSGKSDIAKWWTDYYGNPIARLSLKTKDRIHIKREAAIQTPVRKNGKLLWNEKLTVPFTSITLKENSFKYSDFNYGYDLFFSFYDKNIPDSTDNVWTLNTLETNTLSLYKTQLDNLQQQTLLYAHPKFDVDKPIITTQGELIGLEVYGETRQFVPLSKKGKILNQHIKAITPPRLPVDINVHSLSADGRYAIFSISGNNENMVYHVDLNNNQRKIIHTDCIKRSIYTYPIWHKSEDGLEILSYYSVPHNATRETPLVVEIHGGPMLREFLTPSAQSHFFLDRGFSVLRVNYRGSSGFGNRFLKAMHGNINTEVTEDIIGALENIIKTKKIAPKNIIAYGSSFGGYLVFNLATQNKYAAYFDAFIAHNSISSIHDFTAPKSAIPLHYVAPLNNSRIADTRDIVLSTPVPHEKPIIISWGNKDTIVDPQHSQNFINSHAEATIHAIELPNDGHNLSPEGQVTLNKKIMEVLRL